jgi:protein-disulfide isomerase
VSEEPATLIEELQRRRVFRALVGYGVVAFAVLQIVEPVMHGLHWPDAVLTYVVVALAAGFPLVVAGTWLLDLGAAKQARSEPARAPALRGVRLALLLGAIGALAAAPGVVWLLLRRGAEAKPPGPAAAGVQRWTLPLGDSPTLGPADAPITLVEIGDFQCPYTRASQPHLKQILARYPNKVRLVWKDFPLAAHGQADDASQLAREVRRQRGDEAFWKAYDRLFALAPQLGRPRLEGLAVELRLDVAQAKAALETGRYRAEIDRDIDTAVAAGADGVPWFFVNGRLASEGDGPELDQVIEEELALARQRIAAGVPPAQLYQQLQSEARAVAPPREKVALPPAGNRPARGGPAGKAIEVDEFCDLAEARCAWFEPTLRRTLDSYGDEVRLVWWDLHDPKDPVAQRVSLAADSARSTPGGFWKMHDAILASEAYLAPAVPETLALPALREHARAAGLDLALFDYAMAQGDAAAGRELAEAMALGRKRRQLVIDGELYSGLEPPHLWRLAIDRALARQR